MPYVTKVNTLPADQFYVPDFTDVESSSSLETTQSLEPPPINYSTHPSTPHWLEIYNDTPSLLTYYNAVNPCEVRIFFILCRYYLAVFYFILVFISDNFKLLELFYKNCIYHSYIVVDCNIHTINVKYV